eukprot:gene19675-23401_t
MSGLACAHTVTDLAGRKVDVPDKVSHILLGEGRMIYSLSLLEGKNPFTRIAGWQGDFRGLDVQGYAAFQKHFPEADNVPLVGGTSAETFSAVKQLEAAGVAVIFVDFSDHPLSNTVPSMRLLGKALDRNQQAEDYIAFYQASLAKVTDTLAKAGTVKRPKIFIDMLAGLQDCCGSDPDVYVATGVFGHGQGGVTLGYSATPQQANDSLKQVSQRAPLNELRAVREGNVHGLWHIFYDSPEHLIAVQALAKWLHPELFADLDPEQTRAELYRRFMPIPASGVFTTSLVP